MLGSDFLYACGFRFYFTPLPGFFSPFPHGTRALSVASVYLALRGGPRRFTPAFPDPALLGSTARRLIAFGYRVVTFCDPAFQTGSPSNQLGNSLEDLPFLQAGPTTPRQHRRQAVALSRFRLIPFRSPLLRESHVAFFSSGYLDVSVSPVPSLCPMCSGRSDWA